MSLKVTLPPIPNSLNENSRDLGSLDPHALRSQFNRPKKYTAYSEIASLSMRIESLRQENFMMRNEMYEAVMTQDNAFCQLKRSLLEFNERLSEREKEAAEIKKYYNGSSASSTPTFVEVDIHVDKKPSFDLFATSLLVCNEQRNFFKANDLRRQNEELLALIEHQEETLKMVNSRLQLYWQCQHQNSTKLMIDSLKRGQSPPQIADAAPDQILEQKMKIKLLSNELSQLVDQRRKLTEEGLLRNRVKVKGERNRKENAIKIQKAARGYLVRKHSPLPNKEKKEFQVHEPPPSDSRPPRRTVTECEQNDSTEVQQQQDEEIQQHQQDDEQNQHPQQDEDSLQPQQDDEQNQQLQQNEDSLQPQHDDEQNQQPQHDDEQNKQPQQDEDSLQHQQDDEQNQQPQQDEESTEQQPSEQNDESQPVEENQEQTTESAEQPPPEES